MIKQIAHILQQRIITIPWMDRVGGIVQTIERKDESGAVYKFPATEDAWVRTDECDQHLSDGELCSSPGLLDFIPNSAIRGLLYFEDQGSTALEITSTILMESKLRLVCWINLPNMGTGYDVATQAISEVITKISGIKGLNVTPIRALFVKAAAITQDGSKIFDQYSYKEHELQYLMAPYQAFSVELLATYRIPLGCAVITAPPQI